MTEEKETGFIEVELDSMIWARFMAGALADPTLTSDGAAKTADRALAEWRKRFGRYED